MEQLSNVMVHKGNSESFINLLLSKKQGALKEFKKEVSPYPFTVSITQKEFKG
jgi:hypothetical protein